MIIKYKEMINIAYENINLWFAKDKKNKITTVDEVTEENKSTYYCPLCNSEVIPKAIKKNAKMTSHFAHIDRSKCDSEHMIHWWFKHKFLIAGDKFVVKSDQEQDYICKEVLIEKEYDVDDKVYKPDVTVITECGKTIFFEMAYSNKKKIEEYLGVWLDIGNTVVEVDIKDLISSNISSANRFNALFYNGKCFNVKKNNTYYNIIGKHKESVYRSDFSQSKKDSLQRLDWFWLDTVKYSKGEVDIEYMVDLIDSIKEKDEESIIKKILQKATCSDLNQDYCHYKAKRIMEYAQTHLIDSNKYSISSGVMDKDFYCDYKNFYVFVKFSHTYTAYDVTTSTVEGILESMRISEYIY